jgi:hypothetical protein
MDSGELGVLWITEILDSGYPDYDRYQMAGMVVQLLGKHLYSKIPERFSEVKPTWIPPLLGFVSLCEKFQITQSPRHPGFVALRILSTSSGYVHFGATILPVLTSALLPTHPLRSRGLALKLFHRCISGWFSSQMEAVSNKDRDELLRAVGDPFQFTPDPPPQDEKPVGTANYKPMMAVVVLIEFASSDLWWNHLHRSNFTSCEEAVSTEEGRRTALKCMLDTATHSWQNFLCTPTKIITAIRHLEWLQCSNTAEVVILWAWTIGVVSTMDRDAWRLIEGETLRFYQTRGMELPVALKQHITDRDMEVMHIKFLIVHYNGSPCRVGSVRQSVLIELALSRLNSRDFIDLRVSQIHQLGRFYHLFGYDPMTWKEAVAAEEIAAQDVAVEEVDEEMDVSSERSVTPVLLMEWACDYP